MRDDGSGVPTTPDVPQRLLTAQRELAEVRRTLVSTAGTGLDAADPMTARVLGNSLAAAGLGWRCWCGRSDPERHRRRHVRPERRRRSVGAPA